MATKERKSRSAKGSKAPRVGRGLRKGSSPRQSSTQEVCEVYGVNNRTVQDWVKRGAPCDRKAHGNRFDLTELAAWKKANNLTGLPGRPVDDSVSKAKVRKENALAAVYEMRMEREKGNLIDLTTARATGISLVTAAKNKFMGMAPSMAPQLEGASAAEIQNLLAGRVTEILNELATGFDDAFGSVAGGVSPPEKTEAQRVGGAEPGTAAGVQRGIGVLAE